jgi:hypothetical protein
MKIRISGDVRDRAGNGRYALAHDRGQNFAAGIWVIDPAFILDLACDQLRDRDRDRDAAPAWIPDSGRSAGREHMRT